MPQLTEACMRTVSEAIKVRGHCMVSPILSPSCVVKFETTSVTAQEEFFPILLTLTNSLPAHSLTAFAI